MILPDCADRDDEHALTPYHSPCRIVYDGSGKRPYLCSTLICLGKCPKGWKTKSDVITKDL